MTQTLVNPAEALERPPNHTQLPDKDGTFVHNFQEFPQSVLLTRALRPSLKLRFPGRPFCIGHDSGIYYRWTDPPLDGCKAPDWFIVPDAEQGIDESFRRSFVLWYEKSRPLMALEYASGDGSEERDNTPQKGKLWVYEQGIRIPYYGIFVFETGELQMRQLQGPSYALMTPNAHGRYPIPQLGVELGVWHGLYDQVMSPWLRFWGSDGKLLPCPEERAELAESVIDDFKRQLEEETERANKLAARLRELGIDPASL